jgi:hypothetical protein
MDITDELYKAVEKNMNEKLYVVMKANALLDIADRIEEKHKEEMSEAYNDALHHANDKDMYALGWVKLPKDADGVSIKVGDMLADGLGRIIPVAALELDDDCWAIVTDDGHAYRNPDTFTHHELTLEDVLSEFSEKVLDSGHQWGLDAEDTIGEFAARIRQMINDE